MTRLLVVEDDAPLRRALGTMLRARGFEVLEATRARRDCGSTPRSAPTPSCSTSRFPTSTACRSCRRSTGSDVPIVVLTVRDLRDDKVAALDAGADDYVTKPFDTEELLARIRAALRRRGPAEAPPGVISFGDLQIDLDRRQVVHAGEPVRLTRTELQILELLASNPGQLVTYELIVSRLGSGPEVAALRVHVGNLRRKLHDDAARPRLILTEPGLGYRWLPEGD